MTDENAFEELQDRIQQVLAAESDNFLELLRIAGLNAAEDFAGADLSGTNLSGTNLSGADLSFTNLSNANLRSANLHGANLNGANFNSADLNRTNLSSAIYQPDYATPHSLTLFMIPVSAGFPSLAEDYIEGKLDLNTYLVQHPSATFFVRVAGDSMVGAGIHSGDLLVVDRALEPVLGRVVIAVVNGELTVKRLCKNGQRLLLLAENNSYHPLEINEHTEFQIWGVVTNVIHPL
jgi:DNA polymerase V